METFCVDMQGDVCQTDVIYKVALREASIGNAEVWIKMSGIPVGVTYICLFGQAGVCVIEETGHKVSP